MGRIDDSIRFIGPRSRKPKQRYQLIVSSDECDELPVSKKEFKARMESLKVDILSSIKDTIERVIPESDPTLLIPSYVRRNARMEDNTKIDEIDSKEKQRFENLSQTWKTETQFLSSALEISTHPAYQQIIGMGKVAITLILNSIKKEPDHWFWALKALTGVDPVPEIMKGKVSEMTKVWLNWGIENGYEY